MSSTRVLTIGHPQEIITSSMAYSKKEILELLKRPRNQQKIHHARLHENRVLFHSEVIDRCDEAPYWVRFKEYIYKILGDVDKANSLLESIEFPLSTIAIVNKITDTQKKVFQSQDGYIDFQTQTLEDYRELKTYLEQIGEPSFWEEEGFTCRYSEVNKLLVVDIAESGNPVFYTVGLNNLKDIDFKGRSTTDIDYVVYKKDESTWIFIDDNAYWQYDTYKPNELLLLGEHKLGVTPARFVVSTPYNERVNSVARYSPISPVLGVLDRYLFLYTAKNNYELIAAMPPWWMYEIKKDCDNPACIDGRTQLDDGTWAACPTCLGKNNNVAELRGGVVMVVSAPIDNTDADLRDPIGKVDADAESLKFNQANISLMADQIVASVTGVAGNVVGQEAINEKQVKAQLESERGALLFLAKDIADTRKWLIDTLGKLKLGQRYKGCTVNMGTDFFLLSDMQMIQEFVQLRNSGVPNYIVQLKASAIEQKTTKGKPSIALRSKLIQALEPLTQVTIPEAVGLMSQNFITEDDFLLKLHFSDILLTFETEHGNIEDYKPTMLIVDRIKEIKTKLVEYARQKRNREFGLTGGVPVSRTLEGRQARSGNTVDGGTQSSAEQNGRSA